MNTYYVEFKDWTTAVVVAYSIPDLYSKLGKKAEDVVVVRKLKFKKHRKPR